MLQKLSYNFLIAVESIVQNKTRALLTSLGIIFGVASVIAMLAIGQGAEQEILQQIRILGANNVIVRPVVEQEEGPIESSTGSTLPQQKRPYSPGLTMADARSIEETIPGVAAVSPEIVVETNAVRAGFRRSTKLVGVTHAHFEDDRVRLAEGTAFTEQQLANAAPVAVIGADVKTRFFAQAPAIGNRIKCGSVWLTVVGVLERRALSTQDIEDLGIRDYNYDIYAPINTVLLRTLNRARVSEQDIEAAAEEESDDENGAAAQQAPVNYHQLDRLAVQVESSALVSPVADVVSRMLRRRHNDVVDYQVVIPEQLLEQERRTQTIFNIVLAAIASISLIVGGIGIMNIMLASVMERIREIGVRRSVGAKETDIVQQFLIEALTLSFAGGLLGVALGIGLSMGIEWTTGIQTVVSIGAVLLAFVVSAGVGLIFGLLPAKRAAEQNPVEALRHA
ncbi:MAG: FtsX-like permease family protein [Bacteroidetes bacterium]|jgi:putative ABC transport system permease protein|nr:FtsX-like permease family protein [Bacteroidota bacterium]